MSSAMRGCHETRQRRRILPPETSPLGCSAAKTVPLGRSRATCRIHMSRKAPRGTNSGFGLSPLECPEPCMSWDAPREKPQHLANLPWAVPVRMCRGMRRGRMLGQSEILPWPVSRRRSSPSGSPVSPGRRACREKSRGGRILPPKRLPWPASRRKPSPSGGLVPPATCYLPPATCHQLLAIRWPQSARRRIHQIEMQTSARKTPSCAIVTRVFFRTF